MFPRSLKSKIGLNLAVVLLLGMLLIDAVMIASAQNSLIRAVVSKGDFLLSRLQDEFAIPGAPPAGSFPQDLRWQFRFLTTDPDFSCIFWLDGIQNLTQQYGRCHLGAAVIEKDSRRALAESLKTVRLHGSTWGVFWPQKRYVIISAPLVGTETTESSAISIVMSLESVYARLRESQKMVLIYVLINTILLAVIGLYRLMRITVKPLHRLVERTERYSDLDSMFFAVRKEDNELMQLSRALNQMIQRIAADREKLKHTVASLETANLELKQAHKKVLHAEKLASVGRLSAGIAHEIGNPIGIVSGYLDLLKREDISVEERREFLQRTAAEINRINQTIRQLLDFARPAAASVDKVKVHALLRDIMAALSYQPFMSSVAVSYGLTADRDTVDANFDLLRQVFVNLIINAADALASVADRRTPELKISSRREANRLQINLEDNGPGIAAEHLGDIFDPFFTTKEPGKGTGLGLSVSYTIVAGLGGQIKAHSASGQGTAISVWLPLADRLSCPDLATPEDSL